MAFRVELCCGKNSWSWLCMTTSTRGKGVRVNRGNSWFVFCIGKKGILSIAHFLPSFHPSILAARWKKKPNVDKKKAGWEDERGKFARSFALLCVFLPIVIRASLPNGRMAHYYKQTKKERKTRTGERKAISSEWFLYWLFIYGTAFIILSFINYLLGIVLVMIFIYALL